MAERDGKTLRRQPAAHGEIPAAVEIRKRNDHLPVHADGRWPPRHEAEAAMVLAIPQGAGD